MNTMIYYNLYLIFTYDTQLLDLLMPNMTNVGILDLHLHWLDEILVQMIYNLYFFLNLCPIYQLLFLNLLWHHYVHVDRMLTIYLSLIIKWILECIQKVVYFAWNIVLLTIWHNMCKNTSWIIRYFNTIVIIKQ